MISVRKTIKLPKKIFTIVFLGLGLLSLLGCGQKFSMEEKTILYQGNKTIPLEIFEEAKRALAYFPELQEVGIDFRFKEDISKSFMQAQPAFSNVLKGKSKRNYYIFISSKVNIEGKDFSIKDIPSDVLTGWLGHELGHIMDYMDRSGMGLVVFGLRYVTSNKYIMKAERRADVYAVNQGMGDYILQTKEFILNNTDLSDAYKNRIKRLYLSPEEIVNLVNKLEADMQEAEEELQEVEMEKS